MRVGRGLGRRYAIASFLILALIGSALAMVRPWTWCLVDWSDAPRVELSGSSDDVILDGRPYRVGGNALLDYGLRALVTPLDRLAYGVRGQHHPLTVTASISADSREALGEPVFTCFQATRDGETWARRPTTHPTQTLADGYPPGAPPPPRNEAWRQAVADDGPEWPDGGRIDLEIWASVNGRRYVFVLPPFALMRGL